MDELVLLRKNHILDFDDPWQNISFDLYLEFGVFRIQYGQKVIIRLTAYQVKSVFQVLGVVHKVDPHVFQLYEISLFAFFFTMHEFQDEVFEAITQYNYHFVLLAVIYLDPVNSYHEAMFVALRKVVHVYAC